jgi:23S rRNA pseudouridine2605 synthase
MPSNQLHRTYRVRTHGLLSEYKLNRIRRGVTIEGFRYASMKVDLDSKTRGGTNKWLTLTCSEGKNRQIRLVFQYLGLTVSRLIRTSYGDYQLKDVPPGMVMEVAVKPTKSHRRKGPLKEKLIRRPEKKSTNTPVEWVRHS